MKNFIIYFIVGLISTFITYKFVENIYIEKIDRLTNQVQVLETDNNLLYKKIELIRSNFEEVRSNKKPVILKKNKKVNNKKQESVKKVYVVEGMDKFERIMDSINSTLPNRTGQDLINSLKLKTEI